MKLHKSNDRIHRMIFEYTSSQASTETANQLDAPRRTFDTWHNVALGLVDDMFK